MYRKDFALPASILIIKTSALGDIVQAFYVLELLKSLAPHASIDWAVDPAFQQLVSAHPLIRKAIPISLKKNRLEGIGLLRNEKYDLLFDLQGNCKSGIITFLSKAKVKVGYSFRSAREWPNALATHIRFEVARTQNIRTFYAKLIEQYFSIIPKAPTLGVQFQIEAIERQKVERILSMSSSRKIMVCPGSKWANKQLSVETWISFLQRIEGEGAVCFFLMWGDATEKLLVSQIGEKLKHSVVVEKLAIPTWQNLMNEMDLVIAVDSGALHLCATTKCPSFSIFGPTKAEVFKPLGELHGSIQGACPYKRQFEKQCPVLRSCSTGACMKNFSAEELFQAFQNQCASLPL